MYAQSVRGRSGFLHRFYQKELYLHRGLSKTGIIEACVCIGTLFVSGVENSATIFSGPTTNDMVINPVSARSSKTIAIKVFITFMKIVMSKGFLSIPISRWFNFTLRNPYVKDLVWKLFAN